MTDTTPSANPAREAHTKNQILAHLAEVERLLSTIPHEGDEFGWLLQDEVEAIAYKVRNDL